MDKAAFFTRFPSLKAIESHAPGSWSDEEVPLAQRGVRIAWVINWVRNLLEDINRPQTVAIEQAQKAIEHNQAGKWDRHDQPDMPVPTVPRQTLLNVRALVEYFVIPLTSALKAPLWAFVPPEHRGKPNFFLSHTWSSLLLAPDRQKIGTLDAIEHLDEYIWLDFVSYNQQTIESIPTDMEAVIGEIGKVLYAGTPVPSLGRIWCLWELLCVNRTGVAFDIAIRPGYRNDKILAVNTFYRSFTGVEQAVAYDPDDQKIIAEEVLAQFGSAEKANTHFERILRERLSGNWYELRERDQALGFRPWSWLQEQTMGSETPTKGPGRESDPYYSPGIRESVIYGSRQNTFDMLIESGLMVGADDKIAYQLRVSTAAEHALLDAVQQGDLPKVQTLLEQGISPDRAIMNYTAVAEAARAGHIEMIDLLLQNGADTEGAKGVSPLAAAARGAHNKVILFLLKQGAKLEGDAGGPGTALFQAAEMGHRTTVSLLLKLGADPDAKTEKKATPLLIATVNGYLGIVEQLIAAGADLNCTDRSGDTPLHHAAYKGRKEIVLALIAANADRAIIDKYGDTAFDLGKQRGQLDPQTLARLRVD